MSGPYPLQDSSRLSRRDALLTTMSLATAAAVGGTAPSSLTAAEPTTVDDRQRAGKTYKMKKSINLWAFPYPERMTLKECLQLAKQAGFDGVELNYDLESDLSPKAGPQELRGIRRMAEEIGIEISGLCSFLFWPYPLTAHEEARRARGMELATRMTHAAAELGTKNLLVVPGSVHIPWRDDYPPVSNALCDERAKAAVAKLLPTAEKLGISLNIENIFFNGYLMTPMEMVDFVDHFDSEFVNVHFDTGNIMLFQYPEHWIEHLGKRIRNVHLKEFSKKGTDFSLESFKPLLDGTTNWPAVIDAFDQIGYDGHLTFEYFRPWEHYPEALIYQTSDSLDRMLGRKT